MDITPNALHLKKRSNDEKEVKFKKVGKVQEFSLSFVVATSRHKNAGFYLGRVEFNIPLKAEAYIPNEENAAFSVNISFLFILSDVIPYGGFIRHVNQLPPHSVDVGPTPTLYILLIKKFIFILNLLINHAYFIR